MPADDTKLRPRVLHLEDRNAGVDDIGYRLDARLAINGIGRPFFERLEELHIGSLWRSFTRASSTFAFAGTGVLPRLKKLSGKTSFGRVPPLLVECPELTALEELRLRLGRFLDGEDPDLRPFLGETKLASLRVLALNHGVDEAFARALFRSPLGRQLEVLDLRGNAGLRAIAASLREAWDGIVLV